MTNEQIQEDEDEFNKIFQLITNDESLKAKLEEFVNELDNKQSTDDRI